jgi:putative zinc finger protein
MSGASVAQERAVRSYCVELMGPQAAFATAADTLVEFSRAQESEERNGRSDDELLLGLARVIAAVSLPENESALGCRDSALLLAARANGEINERQTGNLARHLETCPGCRVLEALMDRAERAFRAELVRAAYGVSGPAAAEAVIAPADDAFQRLDALIMGTGGPRPTTDREPEANEWLGATPLTRPADPDQGTGQPTHRSEPSPAAGAGISRLARQFRRRTR